MRGTGQRHHWATRCRLTAPLTAGVVSVACPTVVDLEKVNVPFTVLPVTAPENVVVVATVAPTTGLTVSTRV